ncbi:MAG: Rrf2 family transcriptional regulator [Fusobacteriaceae bacterium]|nr:Rrf2 family transcriptional regulator [Fusobacteriaceae bacterium]
MKVSTKVRYGIKALKYIVEKSKEGKLVRIKEISEAENISVQYLEQILFKLKNEKIIEGKRGPTGGYRLLKEPKEITLHDLYRILDEDEKVIDCNENNGQNEKCCEEQNCKGSCIWGQLDAAMTKILENTTLEDLVKNSQIIE